MGQVAELQRLARFMVKGPDSEDLVQQTIVVALEQKQMPTKLAPWLRQVMRNRFRDHLRRDQRRRAREVKAEEVAPTHVSTDEVLMHRELCEAMLAALDLLPPIYRTALEARFFKGASYGSLAEELGCTPNALRWRVHEGLRRLRVEMDRRYGDREQWHCKACLFGGVDLAASIPSSPLQGAPAMTETIERTASTSKTSFTKLIFIPAGVLSGLAAFTALLGGFPSEQETDSLNFERREESKNSFGRQRKGAVAVAEEGGHMSSGPSGGSVGTMAGAVKEEVDDETSDELPCWQACLEERRELGVVKETLFFDVRWPAAEGERREPDVRVMKGCFDCSKSFDPEGCAQWAWLKCKDGEHAELFPPLDSCARSAAMEWEKKLRNPPTGEGPIHVTPFFSVGTDGLCSPGPDCRAGEIPEASPRVDAIGEDEVVDKLSLYSPGGGGEKEQVFVCSSYVNDVQQSYDLVAELRRLRPELTVHWVNSPIPGEARGNRAMIAAHNQGQASQMQRFLADVPYQERLDEIEKFSLVDGVDGDRFEEELYSEETSQLMADQRAWCHARGAFVDPSFVVKGKAIEGIQPVEEILRHLD